MAVSKTPVSRLERRKARTRAALISAARHFLAAGTTNVSIQEITDAADIGFGSFYNHFSTKDELFSEAIEHALDEWGAMRDAAVEGLDDPAEIFARSFRMAGRIQRDRSESVRVMLNVGTSILVNERGIRPRAVADIDRGIAEGRFTIPDAEVGVMLAGGALLGLMQMLDSDPTLDDAEVADLFAERVLVMLGVDPAEAKALATAELPGAQAPRAAAPTR